MTREERPVTYHTVTLGALTQEGDALAEVMLPDPTTGEPQTRSIPIPAGLPGERVTIAVQTPLPPKRGRRGRRWNIRPPRAWITEIHEASPLRVQAPCPVFGDCGGCQIQHMSYDAQMAWKREVVRQHLREIGNFPEPPVLETVPCDTPWHYRNHMRFSVNRSGEVGLNARHTHHVLPLTNCPIAHKHINRTLELLSQHMNAQPQVVIRCSTAKDQVLLQPAPGPEVTQQLTEMGLEVRSETMEEELGGKTFRIRPSSFFQTNTAQAEKMAQMVLKGLFSGFEQPEHIRQLTIVDAYCGVGTFALLMADHVGKVIAIEESTSAIKDAQWNFRDANNVEVRLGKVENILPKIAASIDGFVIDPPRAGCEATVLDTLIQHPVARIVYVSCNPVTLARDLNILCHDSGVYRLRSTQPLDMFPHTAHIESVSVLERAN